MRIALKCSLDAAAYDQNDFQERGAAGTNTDAIQAMASEAQNAGIKVIPLLRAPDGLSKPEPQSQCKPYDGHKVHPLFDWTDRDVGQYLQKHQLPYYPLWEKGYLSIGDRHTTCSLAEVDSMEELPMGRP